jgi:hypothetical protein
MFMKTKVAYGKSTFDLPRDHRSFASKKYGKFGCYSRVTDLLPAKFAL